MNLLPSSGQRKPMRIAMRELIAQREKQRDLDFNREMRIQEAIEETKERTDLPGVQGLLKLLRESMAPVGFNPWQGLPESEEELIRHVIETLVYSTPNIFVEMDPQGEPLPNTAYRAWKIWDFDKLISDSVAIVAIQTEAGLRIDIESPGDVTCMTGRVADAFERYLYSLGVFIAAKAKEPCPDCSSGPARDCERCGGMGWVLEGAR